ncbi:MAG: serine/threonine-protein kinase [Vicinamibacterales bacterium]
MARMLAPHHTTDASAVSTHGSYRLPASLLSDQVRRLAICAGVGAGLWAFGMVMDGAVRPLTLSFPVPYARIVIEAVSILLSFGMLAYVRMSPQPAQTKVNAALGYFIVNAAGVALLNDWRQLPVVTMSGLLSWNAVVILVAAMIIPASPQRMLTSALIAASMDPLSVWLAHLRGANVPSIVDTFVLFLPNYACAAVAVIPSQVLRRIGRSLREAQDMGSYHLEELLGRGGMGEVWRASHRLLARSAAVKLVRPELVGAATVADADTLIRRFHREAQATAALNSPHTIRLFDFGVTNDRTFYYVMELLAGCDIESLVRSTGPLPAERVMFLLRQICHSLAEAHSQGLVHRDITPRNIYVCRMGLDYDFVKVLDFGLVSFSDRRSTGESILNGGHIAGTPAFMAPEVVLEGAVDARTDIYALGCVLYFLLTGELIFEADTPMKMFVQHLRSNPVPPSERSELPIPAGLDALVMACLEKDPALRPQTIAEVQARLEHIKMAPTWTNGMARDWWNEHLVELSSRAAELSTTMPPNQTLATLVNVAA